MCVMWCVCVWYMMYMCVVSVCVSGVSRNVKEEAQEEAVSKLALKPGPAPLIVLDSRPLNLQDRGMRTSFFAGTGFVRPA